MITDLYVNGTAYVISMCAARSSAEAVELGLTAPRLDDLLEEVRKNSLARQEPGYAIYGAVLLYALRQLGVLENCRTLGDALRELMDNHFADRKAYYFASWLKRFTEAYIHE